MISVSSTTAKAAAPLAHARQSWGSDTAEADR
jgi:hypothetical protein